MNSNQFIELQPESLKLRTIPEDLFSGAMIRIIYLDQNPYRAASVKELAGSGVQLKFTDQVDEAVKLIQLHPDHLFLLHAVWLSDLGESGVEQFRQQFPDLCVMLIAENTPKGNLIRLVNCIEPSAIIELPSTDGDLKAILKKSWKIHTRRSQQRELTKKLLRANEQLEFILRERMIS